MKNSVFVLGCVAATLVFHAAPIPEAIGATSAKKTCVTQKDWSDFRKKYAKYFTKKGGRYIYTSDGKQPYMTWNGKKFFGPGCK